jgi:nucleoside-diphosphate-sugar epimerase
MGKRWGVIGCGWLGLPFAQHLIESGDEVIGSTTSLEKTETLREAGIIPVLLSLKKDSTPKNEFKNCDYVLLNIPPSSLKDNYANNLLNLVVQFNPETRVIFISSTSVYADKNQT